MRLLAGMISTADTSVAPDRPRRRGAADGAVPCRIASSNSTDWRKCVERGMACAISSARAAAAGDSVAVAFGQIGVGIDAPVAKERPNAANVLRALEIDVGDEHDR